MLKPVKTVWTTLADAGERAQRSRTSRLFLLVPLAAFLGLILGLGIFDRLIMPMVVGLRDEVRVPAVGGKEIVEARRLLEKSGLEPVLGPGRFYPGVPAGTVLELSPPTGLSVKKGRQVTLTPSLGERRNLVPDLLGHTLRMARIIAGDVGLELGSIAYAATDLAPPDQILAMSPESGTPASPDGKITLLLSRSRPAVPSWMPNLIGSAAWKAAATLRRSGLHVVTEEAFDGPPGAVAHQDPPAGQPVWPGRTIRLGVVPGHASRGYGVSG